MRESKRELVLVVAEKKREVYGSLILALRENFVVEELYAVSNPDKPNFLFVRWLLLIDKWGKSIKKFRPDKVLICGGSLISVWTIIFLIRLFKLKVNITIFRYDIEHFWPYPKRFKEKIRHFIALRLEKFCLLNSDKILHKGLKNELEFLPFYSEMKDKPNYLFREFLDKKSIQNPRKNVKLSKKDSQAHLVYIGGLYFDRLNEIESFWKFYPRITDQKIHLHVYSKQPEHIVNELKSVETKNRYFHYEGYRHHEDLIKELVKYDYGIHIFGNPLSKKLGLVYKVAFSNKNFDYIAAKLPIIASKNLLVVKKLIEDNNLGIVIDYSDLSHLKKVIGKNPPYRFKRYINKFLNKQNYSDLNRFIQER